jgi:hypothetical protein
VKIQCALPVVQIRPPLVEFRPGILPLSRRLATPWPRCAHVATLPDCARFESGRWRVAVAVAGVRVDSVAQRLAK